MKTPPLLTAIAALLDDTGLFTREEWGRALNLKPEAFDFLEGLSPSTLLQLEEAIREDSNANQAPLEAWDALKSKPLSELTSFSQAHGMALPLKTLGDYLLIPHLQAFTRVLLTVPSERRYEALLAAAETLRGFR